MTSAFKHVVFDLDGTLVDSAPAILASFAMVLDAAGIRPLVELDRRLIGPPLVETLTRLTGIRDEGRLGQLVGHFKAHYDSVGLAATPPYPGVSDLLDGLARHGLKMHIATNKRLAPSRALLQQLGWSGRFESLYALDMVVPRLPDKTTMLARQLAEVSLEPAYTLYIGDKPEDGEAAGANGLAFGYVAWGYGDVTRTDKPVSWLWFGSPSAIADYFSEAR